VASWLVCLSLDQASRNRNRDKLWPGGPLGMYADLTLPYPPMGQEEGKSPVWLWYFQRTQKLRLLQTFLGVLQKKKLGCDERSHLSHEVCPVHSLLLLYLKSPTTNRVLTVTIHTFALGMPSNTIDLGQWLNYKTSSNLHLYNNCVIWYILSRQSLQFIVCWMQFSLVT